MSGALPVASLPMYDWPEVRWATDALWAAIAAELAGAGVAAPARLERASPAQAAWTHPALVLSQCCGYPFATRLAGRVALVGTPVYDAEGCEGPYYRSFVVARHGSADGLAACAGARLAFNQEDSLSGFVAFRAALREAGIDPAAAVWLQSGSHRASLLAVAEGRADFAAIDAVCLALAREHEAEAVARLAIVARTPLRPGLPFISAHRDGALRRARHAVCHAMARRDLAEARQALRLQGLVRLPESAYAGLALLSDEQSELPVKPLA